MSKNIIEEYLVSLGYDFSGQKGDEYIKKNKEVEKSTSDLTKGNDKSAASTKKHSEATKDLQGALKQLGGTLSSIKSGDIFGAFSGGMASAKAIQSMQSIFGAKKSSGSQAPTSGKAPAATSVTMPDGSSFTINPKPVENTAKGFDKMGDSIHKADTSMQSLDRTALATFGTSSQSTAALAKLGAAAGSAGADGSIGAGGAMLGIVGAGAIGGGIAAAAVAVAIGMYAIANGVANANMQVVNLSRTMWISVPAALSLSQTLSAMKMTQADLNNIALNPALNAEFQALQAYQTKEVQLPGDYQAVMNGWIDSVDVANGKLDLSVQRMGQLVGYDIAKAWGPGLTTILNLLNGVLQDIDKILASPIAQVLIDPTVALFNFFTGQKTSSSAPSTTSSAPQSYNIPSYKSLAPNSTSNSVTTNGGVTVTSTPQITINATSNDPQAIGQAVGNAANQIAQNEAALIKTQQGLSR